MEPTPDLASSWALYVAAERRGLRAEYLDALRAFIEHLMATDLPTRLAWINDFLIRKLDMGEDLPLRMPLFETVLFPELATRYEAGDATATRWLVDLKQFVYSNRSCWERLGPLTELGLLKEAYRRDPTAESVRRRLVDTLARDFRYTLHELPSGVLYGIDGATIEECGELLKGLDDFQRLLRGAEVESYSELVEQARFHYRSYREYLTHAGGSGYEEFLRRRAGG